MNRIFNADRSIQRFQVYFVSFQNEEINDIKL